jgi:hypothetical protein
MNGHERLQGEADNLSSARLPLADQHPIAIAEYQLTATARSNQLPANIVEKRVQVCPDKPDANDNSKADERGDKAILDGGHALIVVELKPSDHGEIKFVQVKRPSESTIST